MTEIAFASAQTLAAMLRERKIGCVELLEHYLGRVERLNPAVNAIIVTDLVRARERAAAADRALAAGEIWGPFHGLPITVKESFDVAGLPTTWGVPEYRDNVARRDALAVERWRKSGAVLFGKTNVPIWLADGQSFNAIYGATNNPWDLTRTPGGSSGGAAAALAAGLTGIETGSDIASSIRNPAHYCGVYGHKPTYGLCSPRGHALGDSLAPTDISVIGPLARSAGDLDLALAVLAGPSEIEARLGPPALPPPRKTRLAQFKIGIVVDAPTAEVDREVQDLLQKLADFLARKGTAVSDRARPDIDMARAHRVCRLLLRAATSGRLPDAAFARDRAAADSLDPGDESAAADMLRGIAMPHRDWLRLDEERHKMRWKWHEFFGDYDLLLCPVLATAAPPHEHAIPPAERRLTVNGKQVPFTDQLFWAVFTGAVYLPATAAPIGFTPAGLPVGVQIVGPHYGDRTCIQFAKLLEAEYQAFVAPPGFA